MLPVPFSSLIWIRMRKQSTHNFQTYLHTICNYSKLRWLKRHISFTFSLFVHSLSLCFLSLYLSLEICCIAFSMLMLMKWLQSIWLSHFTTLVPCYGTTIIARISTLQKLGVFEEIFTIQSKAYPSSIQLSLEVHPKWLDDKRTHLYLYAHTYYGCR